jgi:uncharacterized damage-inducible protein DinB
VSLGGFLGLAVTLRALERVVQSMTSETYARSGIAGVTSAVGAHVRHCLDHVYALERGVATGEIDYDHRIRGTAVEQDRRAGLEALGAAAWRLATLSDDRLPSPCLVHAQVHADGPRLTTSSTLGRELAFVSSHTIHHSALIAVLARRAGQALPLRFGYAPSTPAEASIPEAVCAR